MRRSYSAAGTFSLSLSRLDIEKPPGDIHRWRRTNLVVTGLWLLAFVQSPDNIVDMDMGVNPRVQRRVAAILRRMGAPKPATDHQYGWEDVFIEESGWLWIMYRRNRPRRR